MYKFTLTIGDWSGDGHSITDTYTFDSNVPVPEVEAAYKATCERLGTGLHGAYRDAPCQEYEDSRLPQEWITKVGLDIEKYIYPDHPDEDPYVSGDELADLFVDFIVTHNPHISLQRVKLKSFNFGSGQIGYGCYFR